MDRKGLIIILVVDIAVMIFAISVIYSRYDKYKGQQSVPPKQEISKVPEKPPEIPVQKPPEKPQEQNPAEVKLRNILFHYKSANAKSVAIVGDFNNWAAESMKKKEDVWEITLKLKPGKYNYNYLVDGKIVLDPDNRKMPVVTPRGYKSSVLLLNPL